MPDLVCLYYFSGETGESPETPNAFVIPRQSSSSSVTLGKHGHTCLLEHYTCTHIYEIMNE